MDQGIRVSARAIVFCEDRVLLNDIGGGAYYNFPGGGIEPGEAALECVAREVFEETGLRVAPQRHLCTFEPTYLLEE